MAITFTNQRILSSSTDATSYAYGATIVPPASAQLWVFFASEVSTGTPNVPTCSDSGNGYTWTLVSSIVSGVRRQTIFQVSNSGAAPATTIVTVDCGGQTQLHGMGNFMAATGTPHLSDPDGFVVTQIETAAAAIAMTPGTYNHANNEIIAAVAHWGTTEGLTRPTGWVNINSAAPTTPPGRGDFDRHLTQPSGSQSWSWTTASVALGIMVEVRDAADVGVETLPLLPSQPRTTRDEPHILR